MTSVVLKAIHKSFPSRSANQGQPKAVNVLEDINLTVQDGEFLVLVGPSGCGKSTLLRLIAGLETATSGDIWVGDRWVNTVPPKARDIAMVFQSYALYPHLTVYDNLAFGLRRTRWQMDGAASLPQAPWPSWIERMFVGGSRVLPKAWRYHSPQEQVIRQRVLRVAQMLQLDYLLDRQPKQLSGGQKQRVALGRAIARNPQVFLMDEPLSNLDAQLRTETRAQIADLQRELGTTTIYVTHDQVEAMTMGHRIAVMSGGQIQQVARPLELYNRPANRFVAEFIGSPPMNILTVTVARPDALHHGSLALGLPSQWGNRLADYRGQQLWLGIRPEHLQVTDGQASRSDCLTVQVERVEALGSETYLICNEVMTQASQSDTETRLHVRASPDYCPQWGDKIYLEFQMDKIHLFDCQRGTAITPNS